ncbi:capsular polysaccharide biosynthesis protein [Clostridium polyendosporum]|uniref:Capsular polysaccharide biosynthesis protein n=1 Tax=Clostridium polyendosporum TaxID=69208 RepID=A0A919RY68_9CLOT|nr:capsular polysaccharide biosynthesis protein [Clostridium polyendosporum]
MDYSSLFKEKLSKMLFLEVNKNEFLKAIGALHIDFENKDLYIPISAKYISTSINNEYKINNLPIYYFIEGMFYALGADENLRFANDYKKLLHSINDSIVCIKSIISDTIKVKKYEDAFILLKGLIELENSVEFQEKLLLVGETIREIDKSSKEVQLQAIEECKLAYPNEAFPYFYEALMLKDEGEHFKAFISISEYINLRGEKTQEVELLYDELKVIVDYEKGKELIEEEPIKALERLLPLLDIFTDNALIYYYIAVAYRKLSNSEKAIYYLNESLRLDSSIVETVNELGINYACLGDYETAVNYFRKAFDATKDVEVCTNIIMCYINMNQLENAKLHLKIAKKINNEDEIVKKLEEILGG